MSIRGKRGGGEEGGIGRMLAVWCVSERERDVAEWGGEEECMQGEEAAG